LDTIDSGSLLELQFLAEASIDVQFQAWLAASFAVIVAAYSARRALTLEIRLAVVTVYLLAAYALFARWMTEVDRLDQIQNTLLDRGVDVLPVLFAPQARYTTYALGTLITVVAVFYFKGLTNGSGRADAINAE